MNKLTSLFEKLENYLLSSHQSFNVAQTFNRNQENKQTEVDRHLIEDYDQVRDKIPYEV